MKYYIARFEREIPNIPGMSIVVSLDNYSIFKLTDEAVAQFPHDTVPWEEITEIEGTVAWKYYGEVRPYRSAYSDVEGLTPDPESLAAGKRKTKIPFNWDTYNATVLLMKRIFKRNVQDEFNTRESRDGEEQILNMIDSLSTIRELNYKREELLGVEMPKTQLQEMFLWNEETNSRVGRHQFTLGF